MINYSRADSAETSPVELIRLVHYQLIHVGDITGCCVLNIAKQHVPVRMSFTLSTEIHDNIYISL